MKYFVLSIFFSFLLLLLFLPNNVDAICLYDVDWPEKPCHGCIGCYPGLEQERLEWNQYFKFKGEQWMEQKRLEMQQAIDSNTLLEWLELDNLKKAEQVDNYITTNEENHNVWFYYYINGQTPDLDNGKYVFENQRPPLKQFRYLTVDKISCNRDLVLILKYDGSPACVKSSTGNKLLDRGWIKCTGSIIEGRGHPCGPRSSGALPTPIFSNQVIIPKGSANPEQKTPLVPHTITIILAENNTVIWTNQDDSPSTLVADDGSWTTGLIKPGDSVTILFNHTGSFNYHGEPHPWNTGKIIVLDTDNLTMQVISSDWCSSLILDKIPPDGLTKRKDWHGANASIMKIGEDELNLVPHLNEMVNEMKNSSGFTPSEFDKNVMVKQISGAGVNHGKILDWLKENFEKQFPPRGDGAYSSFFQYNGDIYTVKVAQC